MRDSPVPGMSAYLHFVSRRAGNPFSRSQTNRESADGWGKDSVNTMVKRFPGAVPARAAGTPILPT